jgi:hypothetical protein
MKDCYKDRLWKRLKVYDCCLKVPTDMIGLLQARTYGISVTLRRELPEYHRYRRCRQAGKHHIVKGDDTEQANSSTVEDISIDVVSPGL